MIAPSLSEEGYDCGAEDMASLKDGLWPRTAISSLYDLQLRQVAMAVGRQDGRRARSHVEPFRSRQSASA